MERLLAELAETAADPEEQALYSRRLEEYREATARETHALGVGAWRPLGAIRAAVGPAEVPGWFVGALRALAGIAEAGRAAAAAAGAAEATAFFDAAFGATAGASLTLHEQRLLGLLRAELQPDRFTWTRVPAGFWDPMELLAPTAPAVLPSQPPASPIASVCAAAAAAEAKLGALSAPARTAAVRAAFTPWAAGYRFLALGSGHCVLLDALLGACEPGLQLGEMAAL